MQTVKFLPCRNSPLVRCSGCYFQFFAAPETTHCPNCNSPKEEPEVKPEPGREDKA